MRREAFQRRDAVEDLFSQLCHLARVSFLVAETPADCVYAAQFLIGKLRPRRTRLIFPLVQTVDDHAFAQGPVARLDGIDAQRAHRAFKNLTARDDDLCSLRREPGECATSCEI